MLCTNPAAIPLIEKNMDRVNWDALSSNPNAIHLLAQNPGRINYGWLSMNENAIDVIEMKLHLTSWDLLPNNKNAIAILEQNQDKIGWEALSSNPEIFVYNYEKIKKEKAAINEDLVAYVHQPEFVLAYLQHDDNAEVADEEEYMNWFNTNRVSIACNC